MGLTLPSVGENAASDAGRHPPALYRLFFTEMWERFSFYGMRALLVLFMVDTVKHGGMGLTDGTATAIYGIYAGSVYLAAMPGGWVADRWLGARRAVWYGGLLIAIGHFLLALPWAESFFVGLAFVVVGTGLLKPNISAMVGNLYAEGDPRRDAGFTIFYMGINLGAALGPLVCSGLGESKSLGWHYGFLAAGVGMVAGLIQYRLAEPQLRHVGPPPESPVRLGKREWIIVVVAGAGVVAYAGLVDLHVVPFHAETVARYLSSSIAFFGLLYFAWIFASGGLSRAEKRRVGVILVLFVSSAIFWAGFEQAGSSFNLFAERFTERTWHFWDYDEIPAGWFQVVGPVFIITLAPVMAGLWVALARRKLDPSIPVKFGLGLCLLAVGFLIMVGASKVVQTGGKAAPTWLIMTYLIHTFGELCLSPVGLSSVTKLAPRRLVGQMMGVWFLATSLGNVIAGQMAAEVSGADRGAMITGYLKFTIWPAVAGVLLLLLAKPIRKWSGRTDEVAPH